MSIPFAKMVLFFYYTMFCPKCNVANFNGYPPILLSALACLFSAICYTEWERWEKYDF